MMSIEEQVQASAAAGLSKSAIEALLGTKLEGELLQIYTKTKAVLDLKKAQKKREEAQRAALPKPKRGSMLQVNMNNPQHAPGLGTRYKKQQIADVIERAHGMTASICAALDCTHQQYYVYVRKHPELKELQEQCRQDIIDKAEAVIMDNLESDNELTREKAAEYVLNHLGHRRGWANTSNIVGVTVNNTGDQKSTIQAIFGIDPRPEDEQ